VDHASLTLLLADASDPQAAAVRAGLQAAHVDALLVRTHGTPEALDLLLRDLAGQVLGCIDPEAPLDGCRQVRELVDHYALMSQVQAD